MRRIIAWFWGIFGRITTAASDLGITDDVVAQVQARVLEAARLAMTDTAKQEWVLAQLRAMFPAIPGRALRWAIQSAVMLVLDPDGNPKP